MDIGSQLGQLETSGLVRIAQLHPELEYIFRHAMVQDAVYESLLRQDRRRLHRMVGETLERAYPNRLEELAAMLGTHFALAEESARALHYCLIAARSAERRYANAEAITHYSAALQLALSTHVTEPLHELYLGIGKALRLTGQFQPAMHYYEQMQAHAESSGDQAMLLDSLSEQATVYATSTPLHNSDRALALCDQALALARDLHDEPAEAKILWNMMLALKFSGNAIGGVSFGEQALAIARTAGDPTLLAYILNDLGSHSYMDTSQFPRAAAVLQEASEIWRDLHNPHMLTDSLASLAIIRWLMGEDEQALQLAREAWRIADSVGNQWGKAHSLWAVPTIYLEAGRYEDAITAAETCLQLSQQVGFIAGLIGAASVLAYAYAQIGQFERGLSVARDAEPIVAAHLPAWSAWMHASVGLVLMARGNPHEYEPQMALLADYKPSFDGTRLPFGELWVALAQITHGLLADRPEDALGLTSPVYQGMQVLGVSIFQSEMLLNEGRALAAMGRTDEAATTLENARAMSEARLNRRVLWQSLAALADLADQRGDAPHAADLRRQSAEVLTYIEERIKNPDFRASFLALPQVSAIMEGVR